MIRFEDVSVTYDGVAEPTVQGVDFEVPEGELVLLAGPSGVGKSTVLGAVGGLGGPRNRGPPIGATRGAPPPPPAAPAPGAPPAP
ncbi:ATP-binding cassette domain-containing protein, partial [Streptomyces sp. NPDC059701]|uniref:ATP-binding cassette domain-containing protein n=1 Tax=Streptomyces sp. NPDC059701 TaxID=3346914 RepID=UPI0036809706